MSTNLVLFIFALKDYMLPCLSKQVLGFDCPGCGMQRSAAFLLQGEFVAAFKMYPAIYTIIGLFGFLAFDYFMNVKYANKISITLMIASVLLILINFLLKLI